AEHSERQLLRWRAAGHVLGDLDLAVDPRGHLFVVPSNLDAGIRTRNDGGWITRDRVRRGWLIGVNDLGEAIEVEVGFELCGIHGLGVVRAWNGGKEYGCEDILCCGERGQAGGVGGDSVGLFGD